jgi:hypothetical protein
VGGRGRARLAPRGLRGVRDVGQACGRDRVSDFAGQTLRG